MKECFDFKSLWRKQNIKIVLCPDSFKGTLSSIKVANIVSDVLTKRFPTADIVKIPIADGGEGTLDAFVAAADAISHNIEVNDAYFKKIQAQYVVLSDGTAVIEAASVIGLYMIEEHDPSKTSSFGLGEIINICAAEGRKIILALGGSSTTDGGAGIAAACGARFFDRSGGEFIPVGGTLKDIDTIDVSNLLKADITCMCDVANPLYGPNGAAHIYAPQKGADEKMVESLEEGLRHYSEKIKECLNVDASQIEGGGAAGGIGAGLFAFFDAKIKSGIDTVLDAVNFDKVISDADLVITGEGKLDKTSFSGKVIGGILKRTKAAAVKSIAVCGVLDKDVTLKDTGLTAVFPTSDGTKPFEEVKKSAENDLIEAANRICDT